MHQTYSWPDCWRGFRSVSTAALLLVNRATVRYLSSGKPFSAYAIAASLVSSFFVLDVNAVNTTGIVM